MFHVEQSESLPVVLCDAESCGYHCDREKGHGSIHHHPEPNGLGSHDWWMSWPRSEDERIDCSGAPWTGYMLIADVALPLSNDTGVTIEADVRIVELFLELIERSVSRGTSG